MHNGWQHLGKPKNSQIFLKNKNVVRNMTMEDKKSSLQRIKRQM